MKKQILIKSKWTSGQTKFSWALCFWKHPTTLPKQDVIHPQAGNLTVTHISKGKLGPNTTQLQAASQSILSMECALCLHLAHVCDEISFYLLNSHQIAMLWVLKGKLHGNEDVDLGHFFKTKKTFYFVLGYSWLTVLWWFQLTAKGLSHT